MSRIGKAPILLPQGVKVAIDGLAVSVEGPKGRLEKTFAGEISISLQEDKVIVSPLSDSKNARSMWGTARNIVAWMVKGVSSGFSQELEINEVGYRASVKGHYLNLALGKSHNTKIEIPTYIKIDAQKQNSIILESIDKEKLGRFTSLIIKQRPPEPYKGKGIKRKGQYVQRKEGKKK